MIPAAGSYRIQVATAGGFDGVAALVPYFRDLGVATLYLSPIFQARRGSDHGYDVVEPSRLDEEAGGARAFERLSAACAEAGLSLMLDIVPNHMAVTHENPWWWSVLEKGPRSPFAGFFDIDWHEPVPPARGKVVLPILGHRYHRILESGVLQVVRGREGYLLRYFEHVLPLDVSSHPVLSRGDEVDDEDVVSTLAFLNHTRGDPEARAELDGLLSRQPYWLVHWRTAPEEINYRRFFDITHLAALRMEDEAAFMGWHGALTDLLRRHPITGLRIDHVDGLADPDAYLNRLRGLVGSAGRERSEVAILVEKILASDEPLPETWEADGTTGYDFLAAVDGVLLDPDGVERIREQYRSFTDATRGFEEEVRRNKRRAVQSHFRRDLDRVVDLAVPLVREDPRGRDLAHSEIEAALLEITIQLRVYRTYLTSASRAPDATAPLDEAVARARRARRDLPIAAFNVLHTLLGLDVASEGARELATRWQQLTGAVMAKGVEDTTFYVYNPLVSANEVGADPGVAAVERGDFHALLAGRGARWPRTLNASSTHDTKRGEDVRARIHVLSEIPGEWGRRVQRWHEWNRGCRTSVAGRMVPTPNEEWVIYQTLVGVWPCGPRTPDLTERVGAFMRKAAREGKVHTSWYQPRIQHEDALVAFVERILEPGRDEPFEPDLEDLHRITGFHGALNSLSQLALKLAAPGIPDVFQGNELWSLNLVDPDNRRPVDWDVRRTLLSELGCPSASAARGSDGPPTGDRIGEVLDGWRDGRVKLLLTSRGLACRRRHEAVFREGEYIPLDVLGERAEHVVAFARRMGTSWIAVAAPRWTTALTEPEQFPLGGEVWGDTRLVFPDGAPTSWSDEISGSDGLAASGSELPVAEVLGSFPVALLHGHATP